MGLLPSPLPRVLLACVLALALAGCALQKTGPSAVMLSGGGAISSDQGTASREDPPPSPTDDDTGREPPASSETPSGSSQSAAPPSSSSVPPSSSAPPSSSTPPASSSSAPPPPSSQEEPEDQEPEEDEEGEDEPVRRPSGSSGTASSKPEPEPESAPAPEPQSEEPEEDESSREGIYGDGSGWEDLTVRCNGSTITDAAVSIVARIVANEVNVSFSDEAIKAQAVAAYTFVRYHNTTGSFPSVGLRAPGDRVTRLVKEVAGEQITYNGKPILATYCAMSAGWTASSRSVWGTSLPYLVPVESEGDKSASDFCTTVTMPVSQVQGKLEKALNIDLDGVDPGNWFDVLSYWDDTDLYVKDVSIGGMANTTGRKLRENILGLRSAAFTVEYNEGSGNFEFTTYGYGHGVGMSQMGAQYYAKQGWDHVEILEHYYSGTTVG